MTETFTCPACGSPQDPPTGSQTTVECPYCGHHVIVPPEMRPQPPEPAPSSQTIVVNLSDQGLDAASPARPVNARILGCLIAGIVGLVIVSIVVPLVAIPLSVRPALDLIDSASQIEFPESQVFTLPPEFEALLTETSEPPFAEMLLSFGQEGVGAGMFQDVRSVAVDGEGRIYTAEYIGGRVQVFDPQGKFITQFKVDPERALVSMAAGRDGVVYIVQGSQVDRYQGPAGQPLGAVPFPDGFDDVFTTLDGGLLASHGHTSDDIIRLDAQGQETLFIPEAISGQSGASELDMNVAEDGNGNIYALGSFNEALFIYNAQGKYLNRLGSSGDEPGQFRSVEDVVVDGQGRIYVSDIYGVLVFAPDGRYLGTIDIDEVPMSLVVDDLDNLYVAARTKIYKFKLPD